MNAKLIVGFVGLIVTCSSLRADNAPDTRYYPNGSAPDPKDMKGMTHLAPPPPTDTHYYVAAYGGAQWSTGYGDNRQASNPFPIYGTNNTTSTTIHSNWGGVGGVKFGYMFDSPAALRLDGPALAGRRRGRRPLHRR